MTPIPFSVAGSAGAMHSAILYPSDPSAARDALLILAHGAGGGQAHPFMVRYARGLAASGMDVVTFNFPYIDAGRKSPDRAPVLEAAFRHVIAASAARAGMSSRRLYIGGKSMGGRMATHVAAAPEAWPADAPQLSGVIVFGYPLNPPGGPSKRSPDRTSHLARIQVPVLVVQGTRDTFGGPDAIRAALGDDAARRVLGIDGGDHSLAAKFDQRVFDEVVDFLSVT